MTFNNELYGVDKKGVLYILSTEYINHNYWIFIPIKNLPPIYYINTTLDDNYLYIHSNGNNYLYDVEFNLVKQYSSPKHRIYGNNLDTYLSIYNNVCTIYVNGYKMKRINNILSGVMDYKDDVFLLNEADGTIYSNIRILNHKPHYIPI